MRLRATMNADTDLFCQIPEVNTQVTALQGSATHPPRTSPGRGGAARRRVRADRGVLRVANGESPRIRQFEVAAGLRELEAPQVILEQPDPPADGLRRRVQLLARAIPPALAIHQK